MGEKHAPVESFKINQEVVRERLGFDKKAQDRFAEQRRNVLRLRQTERKDQVGTIVSSETAMSVRMGELKTPAQESEFYKDLLRRSIKEEVKKRQEEGNINENVSKEFAEASINQIFSKDVFEAILPKWVSEFNISKRESNPGWQEQSFEQLKANDEFLDYVKVKALEEMKLNFEASIVVSSENVLNAILEVKDDEENPDLLKKRDDIAQDILDFTAKNQPALTEYNSISDDEFVSKYGQTKDKFIKSFYKLFSEKGIDITKEQGRIEGLFNDIRFLCEEMYVNEVKLAKGYKNLVDKAYGSEEEWQKALKEGEEKAKKTITEGEATVAVIPSGTSGGGVTEAPVSSYVPTGTYSGSFKVEGNVLHVKVLDDLGYSDFHPDVKIKTLGNGQVSFMVQDEYGDTPGAEKICNQDEMPFVATKIALDYLLNQGINGKVDTGISVPKIPENINQVITDPLMLRMAGNLLNLKGRPLQTEDFRLMRDFYVVIINSDGNFPYIKDRTERMDAFLADSGSAGHLFKILRENIDNQSFIKSLTVSKIVNREV